MDVAVAANPFVRVIDNAACPSVIADATAYADQHRTLKTHAYSRDSLLTFFFLM
jgi:hypothetical protein